MALQVNVNGTWKDAAAVQVNVGGTWKQADAIQTNVGGQWKDSFLTAGSISNLFMLRASNSNTYITSTDLDQFVTRNLPIYASGKTMIVNGTTILSGGSGATTSTSYATSSNGIDWISRSFPTPVYAMDIVYGNEVYVGKQYNSSNTYLTSTDATNWTARTYNTLAGWSKIRFLNGKFFLSTTSYNVISSTDGINWNALSLPINNGIWSDIAYGNGTYVMIQAGGSRENYVTSTNGTSWTTRTFSSPYSQFGSAGIIFANGKFVIYNDDTTTILISDDGISWTQRSIASESLSINSVEAHEGIFYLTFKSFVNYFYTSTDAINWTKISLPSNAIYENAIAI